jgi:hypothetical protein
MGPKRYEISTPEKMHSWSNPRTPPSAETKLKSRSTSEMKENLEGVDIPDFLRPILGLDFIPYVQSLEEGLGRSNDIEIREIPEQRRTTLQQKGDNRSAEAPSTPVTEKKKAKGILNRLRKQPHNVNIEVIKAPPETSKCTEENFKSISLVPSESDSFKTDENSILANPSDNDAEFKDLRKSLATRHDLMKAGVIQGSEGQVGAGAMYSDEKEFEAIIKSAKEKKKIKPGLLKRTRRRLGGGDRRLSNLTDNDMKELGLARSGSGVLEISDSNSIIDEPPRSSLNSDIPKGETAANALERSFRNTETLIKAAVAASAEPALDTKKKKSRGLFGRSSKKRSNTSSSKGDAEEKPVPGRQRGSTWNDKEESKVSNHVMAQETLAWLKNQQSVMQNHQVEMQHVQAQIQVMQDRSVEVQKRMNTVNDEIGLLQKAMEKAELQLRRDLDDHESTQSELARLENVALQATEAVLASIRQIQTGPSSGGQSAFPATPSRPVAGANAATPKIVNTASLRQRAMSDPPRPNPKTLIQSDSFMRVHDLNIDSPADQSVSSTSSDNDSPNFVFVDHKIKPILQNLCELGFRYVTDESDRFVPKCDTERILAKYRKKGTSNTSPKNWMIQPWNSVQGNDVLVWMGDCGHDGFGSNWPVCKARGLIRTSPRELVEFMMDSTRVKEYNKMSQGRDDLVVFQDDLDTTAEESQYGFAGACKVVRSRNKPRLLPKAIEITSLVYAKPLEDAPGSYMIVNRSVFNDDTGTLKNTKDTITSEMLLGVNLIRPADDSNQVSEFSSVTHLFPPGVPEMLAKRVAPTSALNMIKEIQKLFP